MVCAPAAQRDFRETAGFATTPTKLSGIPTYVTSAKRRGLLQHSPSSREFRHSAALVAAPRKNPQKRPRLIGGHHGKIQSSAGAAHGHQGGRGWPRGRRFRQRPVYARRARGGFRRRRDLEQRILGQERRHSLVDVSQAGGGAESRRAFAACIVFCSWLVGDIKGVRPQRARTWRVFGDGRIRPLWVRLLDHGSRELRQVGAHLRQCRHRQRCRGSEGGG